MTALRRRALIVDDPLAARGQDFRVSAQGAAPGAGCLRNIPLSTSARRQAYS